MYRYLRATGLILLLSALVGCATLQQQLKTPEVTVQRVDIGRVSLTDMDLDVKLGINNPNLFGISLAGLNYRLEVNQRALLQGRSDQRVQVAAADSSQVSLPLSLNYADMADGIGALLSQDTIAYQLTGDLNFGLFSVPYSYRGEVDLPSLPRVSIKGLRVEQIGLQGVSLLLSLGMENPNNFPICLNGLQYDLSLAGKPVSSGQSIGPMEVAASAQGSNTIRLALDYASIGSLLTTLSRGSSIPVDFNASLGLPGQRGEQRLPLQWQGNVAITR